MTWRRTAGRMWRWPVRFGDQAPLLILWRSSGGTSGTTKSGQTKRHGPPTRWLMLMLICAVCPVESWLVLSLQVISRYIPVHVLAKCPKMTVLCQYSNGAWHSHVFCLFVRWSEATCRIKFWFRCAVVWGFMSQTWSFQNSLYWKIHKYTKFHHSMFFLKGRCTSQLDVI